MITAHSGCDGTLDNSREYLEYALSGEADAVEVDVRRASGGELILSHDETCEDALSLEEAFCMMKKYPDKKMNCDLKQKGLEEEVYQCAVRYGLEEQLIFTGDVDAELFRKDRNVYPKVKWYANLEVLRPGVERYLQGAPVEEIEWPREEERSEKIREFLVGTLDELQGYEAAGINWYFKLIPPVLSEARKRNIRISAWTVDDEELQRWFLKEGVDNITSRKVAQLIRIRKEEEICQK